MVNTGEKAQNHLASSIDENCQSLAYPYQMPQSNDVVNLWLFIDEWTRCVGSSYQKDRLYRFGEFDKCSAQFNDIKVALKAKLESSPEKAMDLLETTHYKQNLGSDPSKSPTAGVIWELKEKPSWD